VIRGMVRIGVSSITLCSSSLTLCCSLVTYCSVLGVAVNGGGLRMVCTLDCNNLNRHRPLLVEAATAIVSCSSSMRAHRCWCRDMFGIWQCWGKSSAEPDMYFPVRGSIHIWYHLHTYRNLYCVLRRNLRKNNPKNSNTDPITRPPPRAPPQPQPP
jgi:hypothetical protein